MEFYRKVMTGRGANGTEGIVHVEVTVLEDYFIIYPMKACIINCQQLMPRRLPDNNTNLPTIHQNCQYMLLLPDEFPRKNIKGIQAGLFDIKEKQLERLTLMGYEHVVEVFNHRCLPLEPTRIPKHVSKYSKTIQQIKSPTELSDQLFGVGGDHSSDKTRPEFVKLKFITADENAQRDVLEICDKDINSGDEIDHGKEENAYSEHAKVNQATNTNNPVLAAANNGLKGLGAESVPSGSEEPGFQLEVYEREPHALGKKKPLDDEKPSSTQKEVVPIGVGATLSDRGNLQLVNQTNTSADGSKASNGQNAAMNTDSVPSGSVLSDSSQLEDKQAHNTNKPGVVATNCELNITVANAENYPLALENCEDSEKFKIKSVQEGLGAISKKGKNPVKPAATGGLLTVRTKFPSSQSADESFAKPDDISSDRGTLQLAPYASRSAEILTPMAPMAKMISLLNRLRGSPPIDYYELVKQEIQTQLTFGKLSKGIEELSNEFMEDEKLIKENLRENQSGQEIEKMIRKNALRQNIVNDLKISLALAQTLTNVYELFKQVLEERIKDKETIEKLREELDGTKTKLHKLEKEKRSDLEQAKNEAQGPHDSIDSLQEKKMIEIVALMEKSISRPEQTTLPTELVEKMKQFISLSKKRCDNFRKRSSESSDDDSPDARSNR